MAMAVGCLSVWYVDQLEAQDDSYITHSYIHLLQYALQHIFHKCKALSSFKEVTLYLFSRDIGKGVILTFSVLQDYSPAVRKWLSLFLMAT